MCLSTAIVRMMINHQQPLLESDSLCAKQWVRYLKLTSPFCSNCKKKQNLRIKWLTQAPRRQKWSEIKTKKPSLHYTSPVPKLNKFHVPEAETTIWAKLVEFIWQKKNMEKMKVSKMIHNTHYNTKWATKKKRLSLTSNMRDTQRSSIHWFTAPMPTTHQAGPDPSQKPWPQPTSLRVGTRDSTIRVTPQCLPGCTWARSQNWQRNQNSNQVPQHQKWVSSAAPRLFPHSGPYSCTFCCDEWKFTTWDKEGGAGCDSTSMEESISVSENYLLHLPTRKSNDTNQKKEKQNFKWFSLCIRILSFSFLGVCILLSEEKSIILFPF